jgi:hypothetical protein
MESAESSRRWGADVQSAVVRVRVDAVHLPDACMLFLVAPVSSLLAAGVATRVRTDQRTLAYQLIVCSTGELVSASRVPRDLTQQDIDKYIDPIGFYQSRNIGAPARRRDPAYPSGQPGTLSRCARRVDDGIPASASHIAARRSDERTPVVGGPGVMDIAAGCTHLHLAKQPPGQRDAYLFKSSSFRWSTLVALPTAGF